MNFKRLAVFIIAVLLVFTSSTFGESKKIRKVGVYPLICVKGGIQSAGQLKELLITHADSIREAFEKADSGYLYDGFMAKVNSGEIEEKQLPKGQEIPWMGFKVGKKIKVVKDLVWAANGPLDVFALTVEYSCKDYVMIVPKGCGNLTVMDVKNTYPTCAITVTPAKVNIGDTITVDLSGSKCAVKYEITVHHEGTQVAVETLTDPVWKKSFDKPGNYTVKAKAFNVDGIVSSNNCEASFYINHPPKCDLKVTPPDGYVGQTFNLDATGSTDKDGEVVKADFTITDKGGKVDEKTVTPPPLVWAKKFKKSGIYKVSLKVTDDFNAVSDNDCEFEIKVQKRFYGLFEAGPMLARGTYTGYVFGRLGFAYLLAPEKWSLVVSAGGAIKMAGDRFKNHFLSNVLINAHMGGFFLGAGLGFSTEVRNDGWDSGLDIVGNIGIDVYTGFNKKASIFGEVRCPVGRDDLSFSDAHSLLLGFRYMF